MGCLAGLAALYLIEARWLAGVESIVLGACVTVPLAPVLVAVSVLMWIDGLIYRRLGRLRAVDEEVPERAAPQPD